LLLSGDVEKGDRGMALPGTPNQHGIPAAFLRDDDVLPPPPSDPHWREWPNYDGGSRRASWLVAYCIPLGLLLALGTLIVLVKLSPIMSVLR
jgi:hypothetical protein